MHNETNLILIILNYNYNLDILFLVLTLKTVIGSIFIDLWEPNFEYTLSIFFITKLKKKPFFITYIILWLTLGFALLEEFQISLLFLFLSITILMVYEILYETLNLEKSLYSFLSFFMWCAVIFSYFYTFIILFKGLPEPILITDMMRFSQYRYLALFFIALLGLLLFLLKDYNKYLEYIFILGTFPYIKEEIKRILYKWNDTIWEPFFTYILGILKDYTWCRFAYIFVHFVFFGVFRFLAMVFIVRFILFGGDLRIMLYLSPIFFIIFLISFIEFYYNWFFRATIKYMQEILQVELLSRPISQVQEILFVNTSQFSSKLTPFLRDLWFEYGRVDAVFSIYFKFFRWFSLSILSVQILSWIYLIHLFFLYPLYSVADKWVLFSLSRRCMFPTFPFQVRSVHKHLQSKLEQEQEGSYSKGHLVIVDPDVKNPDNSSEILYGGQPTHGNSTVTNPSQPLAPVDIKGSNIPQNVVPPVHANTYVNIQYLNPIPVIFRANSFI